MFLRFDLEQLKARKKELRLTNLGLSKLSGIPVGTLNKILSGATKYPREETLVALMEVLEMDYRYHEEDDAKGVLIRETPAAYLLPSKDDNIYTIADYYALPDDVKVELIDGKFFYMQAPKFNHQILVLELTVLIREYLRQSGSRCRVFLSPCDVQLDNDIFTMVQPDIMVICDKSKYQNNIRCYGAPDLVIEVASESTYKHDSSLKLRKYRKAGVSEYWTVNHITKRIVVYAFKEAISESIYTFADTVPSRIFSGLVLDFKKIESELL